MSHGRKNHDIPNMQKSYVVVKFIVQHNRRLVKHIILSMNILPDVVSSVAS